VPNEEEQLAAYRSVIEASPNRTVTVRTLDLGGDKQVPYLGNVREANPFMGWRSIRLSTEYPEFFPNATAGHPPSWTARRRSTDVSDGFNVGRSASVKALGKADGGRAK
jgi:hypothetical protein